MERKFIAGFFVLAILVLLNSCPLGTDGGGGGGGGLSAPFKVTAEAASSTSIYLTWTAVSGAAKYKIYSSVTSTGVYLYVDETIERSYVVNDLVPSSTYYFKVSSVDISGVEGPKSDYAAATTFYAPIQIPGSPQATAISSDSIEISWNAVTGAYEYRVYRNSSASGTFTLLATRVNTSHIDAGLSPLTTWYYKVSAVTSRGESEQSNPVNATTPAQNTIFAPGGIQAVPLNSNSIQISWNAQTGALGYKIYRSNSYAGSYGLLGTRTETSHTDTGLLPLTTYYYKVSTLHSGGESVPSSPVEATTPAEAPIQPPTGLSAFAVNSSTIQVSWSSVLSATAYNIYRSNSASGSYNYRGSSYFSPFTDSGLNANSTWYYKVSSTKDSQESAISGTYAFATTSSGGGTIPDPPAQPNGLVAASVSLGSITLNWNPVAAADIYNIYRSNTQTGAAGKIATITGTTYTNNTPAGVSYYYSVTGENSSGESPKSAMAFAFASDHYNLSSYYNSSLRTIAASDKHYYRLAVNSGQSYTIEWQNGSNQNADSAIRVAAWQNNGTPIFTNAYNGYSGPKVFTATATGFVTVEVSNVHGSSSFNYQIYTY